MVANCLQKLDLNTTTGIFVLLLWLTQLQWFTHALQMMVIKTTTFTTTPIGRMTEGPDIYTALWQRAICDVTKRNLVTLNMRNSHKENMSGSVTRPSVDNLIDDIRKLYNKSKTSLEMSCDLVDKKLEKRSTAQQRELARNVARASKQFNEMFKTRSFYEKMSQRSRTVNAPSTNCDHLCSTHGNNLCSCESLASASLDRRLHSKIPQVYFFSLIEHQKSYLGLLVLESFIDIFSNEEYISVFYWYYSLAL